MVSTVVITCKIRLKKFSNFSNLEKESIETDY